MKNNAKAMHHTSRKKAKRKKPTPCTTRPGKKAEREKTPQRHTSRKKQEKKKKTVLQNSNFLFLFF
jgi:hypothetical protein